MAGVFLSYSRADHALAQQIIDALRRIGVEVWWDQDMPGVDWQEELARELDGMAAVAVIWTTNSASSKYVRDEARLGLHNEKLINVLAGATQPPFPFDRVNGLSIDGWDGVSPHGGWTRVVQTIEQLAVAAGSARRGEITSRLAESEKTLLTLRAAFAQAEEAFHDAQAAETDAAEGDATAQAALRRAEADLDHVRATSVGPAILRAAQQEYDSAEAQAKDAAQALRTARTQLSATSRSATQTKAALAAPEAGAPTPASGLAPPRARERPPAGNAEEPTSVALAASARRPQTDTQPPRSGKAVSVRTLLAGGGLVAALLLVAVMVVHPAARTATPGSASSTTLASVASTTTDSAAAAQAAATGADPGTALVGRWRIAGLGCDSPVVFAEADGALTRSFAGASVSVRSTDSPASGVLAFRASDGARYRLGGGSVSVIPAGASQPMKMTRCAD